VIVPGFVSHLEVGWENQGIRAWYERLSRFARLITFDKRGTGMSDPVEDVPTLEQRMDDVRAVMDAAGSERAALLGISEGAPMCMETDVREALPLVSAPTLVIHRRGDRVVSVHAGRYLAEHIKGARYVELEGKDHVGWAGNVEEIAGEVEEFITGARSAPDADM